MFANLLAKDRAIKEGDIIPANAMNIIQIHIQNLGDLAPVTFKFSMLSLLIPSLSLLLLKIQPTNNARDTIRETTSEMNVLVTSQASTPEGLIAIPNPRYKFCLYTTDSALIRIENTILNIRNTIEVAKTIPIISVHNVLLVFLS